MNDIKRGEMFYISRGGHRTTEVNNMQTVRQSLSAMTRTMRMAMLLKSYI